MKTLGKRTQRDHVSVLIIKCTACKIQEYPRSSSEGFQVTEVASGSDSLSEASWDRPWEDWRTWGFKWGPHCNTVFLLVSMSILHPFPQAAFNIHKSLICKASPSFGQLLLLVESLFINWSTHFSSPNYYSRKEYLTSLTESAGHRTMGSHRFKHML